MEDRRLPRPQRRRRVGVEGIGLGLHRRACAVESEDRNALRNEAPCPHGAAGGQEVVRRLGTQSVGHGHRKGALGVPHVTDAHRPGQRRELMHDHLRLGLAHNPSHGIGVESVGHHGARSQAAQQILLRCAPGHPDHLMSSRDELRDQRSAESACGAG
jgi:hypothetical protein